MNLIAALFISAWLAAYCQRIPDPEEVQLGNSFVGTLPPIRLDQRSSAPCLDEEISIYTRDGQFGPGWLSGSRGTALEIESDRALFRSQDDPTLPLWPPSDPTHRPCLPPCLAPHRSHLCIRLAVLGALVQVRPCYRRFSPPLPLAHLGSHEIPRRHRRPPAGDRRRSVIIPF